MERSVRLLPHRAFLLGLCCAVASLCLAQKPVERDYLFEVQGLDDRGDEKVVLSVLKDMAPEALVSVSTLIHQVKVRCTTALDPAMIDGALDPWDLHLVRWNILSEAELNERRPTSGLPPDFPVLIPTGDPAADEADLRRRKEEWYAAHPEHPLSPH